MTKLFWFVLAGLLVVVRLAADQVPAVARPYSEEWGDELVASGDYRGAFTQYAEVASQWQVIRRIDMSKTGNVSDETQGHLESLARKLMTCIAKLQPAPVVPTDAVFAAEKALAYVEQGDDSTKDYNAALQQLDLALWSAPWVCDYYYKLGVCLYNTGKPVAAVKALRLAGLLTTDKESLHTILSFRANIEVELEKKRPR
jgi:tetratricopeptide (TPR) repeat protein